MINPTFHTLCTETAKQLVKNIQTAHLEFQLSASALDTSSANPIIKKARWIAAKIKTTGQRALSDEEKVFIAQLSYRANVKNDTLVMQFRGVPLIPPPDCTDPQSWIAEQIYQMGAATAEHEQVVCRDAAMRRKAADITEELK